MNKRVLFLKLAKRT